jgi:hypothetical protein
MVTGLYRLLHGLGPKRQTVFVKGLHAKCVCSGTGVRCLCVNVLSDGHSALCLIAAPKQLWGC